MKKSELIQKLIEIEEKRGDATITMNYIHYLKKLKKLIEEGDIDIEANQIKALFEDGKRK